MAKKKIEMPHIKNMRAFAGEVYDLTGICDGEGGRGSDTDLVHVKRNHVGTMTRAFSWGEFKKADAPYTDAQMSVLTDHVTLTSSDPFSCGLALLGRWNGHAGERDGFSTLTANTAAVVAAWSLDRWGDLVKTTYEERITPNEVIVNYWKQFIENYLDPDYVRDRIAGRKRREDVRLAAHMEYLRKFGRCK